ncbi:hypothetical protein ACLQ3D_08130 [Micromonospora vinacea]|uniref:Lectin n=1 Tax=Micromonospora vinacea TaxID=709878 RepID=A0ABS0K4W8_9ACTN|nr:hypothetical protein [Micromonospora vinacea]MBG6103649.1 hypothetical protein [Micromonospora vinacea]WTA69876.1 hypothetical protein OHB51_12250 [Micromonospora sp. NBC_00855]
MNRPAILLTTAALALGTLVPATVGGPAAAAPPAGGAAYASAPGPLGTTVEHSHPEVLSVRGAGVYRIGASLASLTRNGHVGWTAPGCDGVVHTGVTGSWAGVLLLAFRNGRLVEVGTATAPPRSPAGASVGMSFDELEAIYGRRGSLIRNDAGDAEAYLVRVGSRVELFTGHPIRPGVGYFQVGPASFVERNFRQGPSC